MYKSINYFLSSIFLTSLFTVFPAVADNVTIAFSIDNAQDIGDQVQGTMTAQVMNNTNTSINNVDLKLVASGSNSIVHRVIQVGQIAAGQTQIASGDVYFESTQLDQLGALPMQVDYDDTNGSHQSVTITAIKAN